MTLLDDVDRLYEGCVMESDRWTEQAFVDWVEGVGTSESIDREVARYVRRCVNAARKLAAFWSDGDVADPPHEWRSRVDMALGTRAWRPQLDLAMALLDRTPTPETFEVVSVLFPVVANQPFLDGIDFDEWLENREVPGPGDTIPP